MAADINVGFAMLFLRRERVFLPTDAATAFHSYVYLRFYNRRYWKSAETESDARLACLIIMKIWFRMAIRARFYKLEAIRISKSCLKH